MSLLVLLGDRSNGDGRPSAPSQPPPAPVTASSLSTAAELEGICHEIVAAMNAHSFEALAAIGAKHFRRDFKSSLDNALASSSLAEFYAFCRAVLQIDPNYHYTLKHVQVDVNEQTGHADAFMMTELTGTGGDVVRISMAVVRWRRRDGRWIGYQMETIRGIGGIGIGE